MVLRIVPVGVGSAFAKKDHEGIGKLYQTNLLIEYEVPEERLRRFLFDCGSDARFSLDELGLDATHIDEGFISHLHADHVGGVEWWAMSRHFAKKPKSKLYLPPGLYPDVVWDKSLRGGLGTLEVHQARLDTYFDVQELAPNQWLQLGSVAKLTVYSAIHFYDGGQLNPCFGFLLERADGYKVLFSGDTQFVPVPMRELYPWADLIIHDCETTPYESGIHAHYRFLKTLDEAIKGKMVLIHYNDNFQDFDPVKDGFLGWAQKGRDILEQYAPPMQ